ncbi:MAG: phosphoribosylformylglycinamidine synthase [Omnitrophica bacterium RIFCSPLOWO2_12_FULL_44_17]|uniref:Phosphoribosylformylglycinamidine synthase subunit PurS n=1 Tax=Candidatus Danuiimicrobium aquiferis TaxID=1801832 RepID=A0A1G1KWC7_9BACT|nr:MAG: phosphoribosylformylglycinamidine synthase [Omnitrophica bacterium RIFCSPHIGHO2_02_FULL_45_28]OGW90264.1 MAG: phosphoribosylformylglycinamidine synthase [Omnitrophica bacterium RIFCSPHIGHO2_12_FULL_44_12]OGW97248.1 MAG: phosphoribosylformylglycinamidine synthase [Omnitrophica bacterium RIFCSPLOWO2_12_FULL_44_17]OGX02302.1 MAG: phosphoribosylformylglycinamidine synthase [Omnitrophica bacterium RIFCSPLOWO2_02_FULL_44_11]
MYKAKINVTLKKSVLDPQGKTVLQAVHSLGFHSAQEMRVGKYFELSLNSTDRVKAEQELKAMCAELLVNPVIEDYTFQLEEVR